MDQSSNDTRIAADENASSHVSIAQTGDQTEFGTLLDTHRKVLLVHCYRMLGSPQDAEDAVQETMVRAWRSRSTFTRPISFRAWLYRIATNVCLNFLEQRPSRTLQTSANPNADHSQTQSSPISEPIWIEPIPDEWLADEAENPEARYSAHESISLAFLAALQFLSPPQRAVLLLREALGWHAEETAALLEMTVSAVNSALHRAREALIKHYPEQRRDTARARSNNLATQSLLEQYIRAWENADIAGLVSLLRADAVLSMPPIPGLYQGPDAIASLLKDIVFAGGPSGWEWRIVHKRANGNPALAMYRRASPQEPFRIFTFQTLDIDPGTTQIAVLINFLTPTIVTWFGLPVEFAD